MTQEPGTNWLTGPKDVKVMVTKISHRPWRQALLVFGSMLQKMFNLGNLRLLCVTNIYWHLSPCWWHRPQFNIINTAWIKLKFKSDHVKIEVASHFPHFWSQFLTDFDVTPLKSKLRTSSTRICSDHATMIPIRGPKMAKNTDIGNFWSIFCHFWPL